MIFSPFSKGVTMRGIFSKPAEQKFIELMTENKSFKEKVSPPKSTLEMAKNGHSIFLLHLTQKKMFKK